MAKGKLTKIQITYGKAKKVAYVEYEGTVEDVSVRVIAKIIFLDLFALGAE